jgi:transcriptional regulator with XRE-family HTH domain
MQEPGRRLRHTRERLKLKYRDVEQASQHIAARRGSDEFLVGLSRLADIENKGTVPSIFRLYSLCAIYRLDFEEVLQWFGVDLNNLLIDAAGVSLSSTHVFDISPDDVKSVSIPADLAAGFEFKRTTFLPQLLRKWTKVPLHLLQSLDTKSYRYGFIGSDDWSMHPVLPPGCFIQIDQERNRIVNEGWSHESERPIYFVEHRRGYCCGWCTQVDGLLIVQPHSSSQEQPKLFRVPGEAEVVGQVVAVAKRLDRVKRPRTHS